MKKSLLLASLVFLAGQTVFAWDYEGHRLVNQLALSSLPKDFPAFALTSEAQERIAFLAGEPDRWRNTDGLELKHANGPEHYINLEEVYRYDLTPQTLPPFRYDFMAQMARARAAHPDRFPPIDPAQDTDHTRELSGFLPWTMAEYYAKLKSEFSYLKAFEAAGGTPAEIANAQENIIYTMGVMGHFYGDASQPLHTTMHFNGWFGSNPNHYTTNRTFHALIDGGYILKTDIEGDLGAMKKKMRPAELVIWKGQTAQTEQIFPVVMSFIVEQNKLVEPLYQMEKDHKFTGEGEIGLQGKPFIEGQLLKAARLLGDIWYSAWKNAPVDQYFARQLQRRSEASGGEITYHD
ncbi:MAG TPA: hypothetical protein VN873_12310 [Candidatus Angelobacter sp.]|nr:hypothetical protein [Candidatus Angelobacter sp.]